MSTKINDPETVNCLCIELTPAAMGILVAICKLNNWESPEALIRHLLAEEAESFLSDGVGEDDWENLFNEKGGQ
jgi:hypothetical protein